MSNSPNDEKKHIVKLAHIYYQEGRLDQALAEYRKILVIDPDDLNVHNILGDIYLKKDSVIAAYEAYHKTANGFLERGQVDKAILVFKKITKLDPGKLTEEGRSKMAAAQSYVNLDEAVKVDKVEEAIEIIGKILKIRAQDPVAQAKLTELDAVIAEMPPSVEQYQSLGDAFLKNGILEKAQEMFRKIADMDPQNATIRSNLALMYLKQGSESDAKKEYLGMAEDALTRGDLNEAFNFAQKAIELKSVEAHYVSGLVYFKNKKWTEAKDEFVKLLRAKVNHLGALIHLGRSLDSLGQTDKAGEFLSKALKMDQDDLEAQEAWIEFCVKHKDKAVTISYLTVLLDKAAAKNDAERAVKLTKMMIRLNLEAIQPQVNLIQMLQSVGDLNGAADACCALALIYERQNDFKTAAEYLEKALELSPANAEVLEKVLTEMKHKADSAQTPDSLTLMEEHTLFVEETTSVDMNPVFKMEPQDLLIPPQMEVPQLVERTIPNVFESQLAIADQCVQQGLLKAAIEIYQQLLANGSDSLEIKTKLNEVNDLYVKKWMESNGSEIPSALHLLPNSMEKKMNAN